jgi:hypothetical protein
MIRMQTGGRVVPLPGLHPVPSTDTDEKSRKGDPHGFMSRSKRAGFEEGIKNRRVLHLRLCFVPI